MIRIMPNTPCAVGEGVILCDASENVTAEELAERGIRGLPASLDAAVRAMEADAVVMDALGPYAVRYAAGKRREWEEYRTQISQWELDQYLANC